VCTAGTYLPGSIISFLSYHVEWPLSAHAVALLIGTGLTTLQKY
jgi:hypothetical protein